MAATEPPPLSPIDHLFIGRGMSLVLHYPGRLEAKRLAASLEEVLKAIPLLAGGLVQREDGRYGVGPLSKTVERLEVREVPSLPEVLDEPLALRELVPWLLAGPEQPVVAARLTLAPRDSVLAVTISHAVADGFGFFMFMRAWSRAAAGKPLEAPPTDRRLLAIEVPAPTAPLTPEDVRRRTGFTWSPGHPRRLDAPLPTAFGTRVVPPDLQALAGDEPLSDNDVLCGWLLKTHTRALAGPQGLAVAMTVGYRQNYGGLPRNYLGNAFRAAPLWLPREVLERESILELAARVQQAIRNSFGEQAARDSVTCLEQLLREQGPQVVRELHPADPLQGALLTNISRLPFGILEFGQGPIQLDEQSVSVTWLPCFHDMGLINGVLEPVYVGCISVMMSPLAFIRRPRRWLEALTRYQATHSGGPNFAYDLCVRKVKPHEREGLDLSCWRQAYLSAEPVRRDTLERFHEAFTPQGFRRAAFYPCYGLAEATLAVTGGSLEAGPVLCTVDNTLLEQRQVREVPEGAPGSTTVVGCGVAGLDTEVLLVDPETRRRVGTDGVGELWVRGPGVARGYLGHLEETRETFGAHLDTGEGPYLRSGDLGFLRGEELFLVSRLKDVLIIRGRNHHPQDLEWAAGQCHPALRAGCAAAFLVEQNGREELVLAQEVSRESAGMPPAEELAGDIREAVSEQYGLMLDVVVLVSPGAIPRTSSGKIQRSLCRTLFLEGQLDELTRDVARNVQSRALD